MEESSKYSLSLPTIGLIGLFHPSSSVGVKRYFAVGRSTFKGGSHLPCTALYPGGCSISCFHQQLYQLAAGQVLPRGDNDGRLEGGRKRETGVFLPPVLSPATSPPWLQLLTYRPTLVAASAG